MIRSLKLAPMTAAITAAVAVLALGLSACNTVEGAGKDVKSTGKAIERTANENK